MADASDSKSDDSNIVWVQVPPPAPLFLHILVEIFILLLFHVYFFIARQKIFIHCFIFLFYRNECPLPA